MRRIGKTTSAMNNYLFITLDSCRYDTFLEAKTPFLDKLGKVKKALTHGTYTLPAHSSFFVGHFPNVFENPTLPYYSENISQLWRVKRHLSNAKPINIELEGKTIFEGFENLGYYVLGLGGVSQFVDGSPLRKFFKNFIYYGSNADVENHLPREYNHFPLNHVDEIIKLLSNKKQWFLFINSPESHIPYDWGEGIPKNLEYPFSIIRKCYNIRSDQQTLYLLRPYKQALRDQQIKSIEVLDSRIELLVNKLPKNNPITIVICGDHGTHFGEEFLGVERYGHMVPSKEVLEVPLIIATI